MNSCHSIDALLTPFIDGVLADADRRVVEDHLRRCAPCHSREAAERAVRTLVHARKDAFAAPRAPEVLRAKCAAVARGPQGVAAAATRGTREGGSPASWRSRLT